MVDELPTSNVRYQSEDTRYYQLFLVYYFDLIQPPRIFHRDLPNLNQKINGHFASMYALCLIHNLLEENLWNYILKVVKYTLGAYDWHM